MADIYHIKGQIGIPEPFGSPQGNGGQVAFETGERLQKKADNLAGEAEKTQQKEAQTYFMGLENTARESLNEIYEQYAVSPTEFEEHSLKLRDDISNQIGDPYMREQFKASYDTRANTYLTRSKDAFEAAEYGKYKSTISESITSNTGDVGLSFGALMSKNANDVDILNANKAMMTAKSLRDTLNKDGTYMFSDAQRETFLKDENRAKVQGILSYVRAMPLYEQQAFVQNITKDEVTIGTHLFEAENGKRYIAQTNLMDILEYEDYEKVKTSVLKAADNAEKIRQAEPQLTTEEAAQKASVQTLNNMQMREELDLFKEDKKDIKLTQSNAYDLLAFRQELQQKRGMDGLSDKDYKEMMEQTALPLIQKVADKKGMYTWWDNDQAFITGVNILDDGLEYTTDAEQAYVYSDFYNRLGKQGIPHKSDDQKAVSSAKEIALAVKKNFLERKAAGLVGLDVGSVLINGKISQYQMNKPVYVETKNYRVIQEGGLYYAQYPDDDGEYTAKSVRRLISQKQAQEEEPDLR